MYYTDDSNNIQTVQYRRAGSNPNLADASSAKTVLRIDHHDPATRGAKQRSTTYAIAGRKE